MIVRGRRNDDGCLWVLAWRSTMHSENGCRDVWAGEIVGMGHSNIGLLNVLHVVCIPITLSALQA